MSGTNRTEIALDERRKRARFRARHRGTRELDLLLGPFADAAIFDLSESDLALFEALLEVPEPDLFAWIIGIADTPSRYDTPLLAKIRAFHKKQRS